MRNRQAGEALVTVLMGIYFLGQTGTFAWLVFKDWPRLNWWNWIIVLPIDGLVSTIWPIYWLILRPLMGA